LVKNKRLVQKAGCSGDKYSKTSKQKKVNFTELGFNTNKARLLKAKL
jgi:hypothetical protein